MKPDSVAAISARPFCPFRPIQPPSSSPSSSSSSSSSPILSRALLFHVFCLHVSLKSISTAVSPFSFPPPRLHPTRTPVRLGLRLRSYNRARNINPVLKRRRGASNEPHLPPRSQRVHKKFPGGNLPPTLPPPAEQFDGILRPRIGKETEAGVRGGEGEPPVARGGFRRRPSSLNILGVYNRPPMKGRRRGRAVLDPISVASNFSPSLRYFRNFVSFERR